MNIITKTLLAAPFVALILSSAIVPAAAQGGSCLSNREIQDAIASGEILPVSQALQNAGVDRSQEVLSVKVCDNGGQLYYIVAVINSYGQAENLTISAY